MLMDISSEMIHSLLPMSMVTTLGNQHLRRGSGRRTRRVHSADRQNLLGFADTQRLLGQAQGSRGVRLWPERVDQAALCRCTNHRFSACGPDRVGKGVRDAPRDALIADLVPSHLRGASFGLRQSRDTVGPYLTRWWPSA